MGVYWADNGTVMKAPLSGRNPTAVASALVIRPSCIAVDATSVYWSSTEPLMKLTPK